MNILHINHLMDRISGGGGMERTYQLCRHLAMEGWDAPLLTMDIGHWAWLTEAGVDVTALPCRISRYFIPRDGGECIDKAVRQADAVHMIGHWTVLNAMVYRACRRYDTPYVHCPAGALMPFGRSRMLKWVYNRVIGTELVRNAAVSIAITDNELDEFAAYGVAPERKVVIPNGIDPEDYDGDDIDGLPLPGLPDKVTYIFFLGRLNPIKGPDLLLEAFLRIAPSSPELHLVFGGPDGGLRTSLEDRILAAGMKTRVHFLGHVSGKTKAALLRGALGLVIPSRREAMSIVILEAGICATPAVFTDTCGLAVFADRELGIAVSPTVEGLEEGIRDLLANRSRHKKMAERLHKAVLQDYLWSAQAACYRNVYENLSQNFLAG